MLYQQFRRIVGLAVCLIMLGSLISGDSIRSLREGGPIKVPSLTEHVSLSRLKFGAWLSAWPTKERIETFQVNSGRHMDIVNIYVNWSHPFTDIEPSVTTVYDNQSEAMLTWEPDGLNTEQIAMGKADAYIVQFADALRDYGKPFLLRPMHEMNGNWYSWATGDSHTNTNDHYIRAWKHIVEIFRRENATNVQFVWCINAESFGRGASYTGAYPGDGYVSYVSIDGYNWGRSRPSGQWKTFSQIFTAPYRALTGLTQKPILISEWASTEKGGDKATWIRDGFQQIVSGKFPRIVGLLWFNEQKETNWLIESSSAAQRAYYQALHS